MLLYGDSHIVRLEEWVDQRYNVENIYGPTPLDHIALSNIELCAVGGTRFNTIHEKVCGVGVPKHQRRQGNQWDHIVNKLKLQLATVIISLGGNDYDRLDKMMKRNRRRQLQAFVRPTRKNAHWIFYSEEYFWEVELMNLYHQIDDVIMELKGQFPETKLYFMGILKRSHWSPEARKVADNVDWYLKKGPQCKLLHMNGLVRPEHFLRDRVHLTGYGYQFFMDKIMTHLLQTHWGKYLHAKNLAKQRAAKKAKMDKQ